jgi:hypothetical protein
MRGIISAAAAIMAVAALGAPVGSAEVGKDAVRTVGMTVTPVRPYQPGDQVWLTTPPVGTPSVQPFASGCERVPATGYISTNVYASSSTRYANFWQWGSASSGQPFNWYVKRTDGSNVASGTSNGGGSQTQVGANSLYWKVQNRGSTPQAWNVCYDVL